MWGWLLLLAFLALVVALTWIPIHFVVDATRDAGGARGGARIEWLFGALRKDVRAAPAAKERDKRTKGHTLAMLRTQGFPTALRRLARRVRRATRLLELRAHARVGLADPADTGVAMGLALPLLALMPLPAVADVRIEPDFDAVRFEGKLHARARVWPALVLAALALLAFTPATWRALRAWRRGA